MYHFQSLKEGSEDSLLKEGTVNARLEELELLLHSTEYAKQKSKLQIELEQFLKSLAPSKSLACAHPSDITKFLVSKDTKGKTQVHLISCANKGCKGQFNCGSPMRAAAGSGDSLIGKIRAIYRDRGYGTQWNGLLGTGFPAAAATCIKRYLSAVKLEQSLSAVPPKQVKPLFSPKLCLVSRHISYKLRNPKNSILQQYLLKRDLTFFTPVTDRLIWGAFGKPDLALI